MSQAARLESPLYHALFAIDKVSRGDWTQTQDSCEKLCKAWRLGG